MGSSHRAATLVPGRMAPSSRRLLPLVALLLVSGLAACSVHEDVVATSPDPAAPAPETRMTLPQPTSAHDARIPPIDRELPARVATATFALG